MEDIKTLANIGVTNMNDFLKHLNDPFSFPKQFNTTVGFDEILKRLATASENFPKLSAYPPYNIRKVDDNKYVIEIAVAGFGQQDLEIELKEGVLSVKGNVESKDATDYLFKGIADRAFTRTFTLADTVEVKNADLINGMLKIWLERFIPEEKKAKKVPINDAESSTKQFLTEKYGK
jgi:molecular chaperone IbpA